MKSFLLLTLIFFNFSFQLTTAINCMEGYYQETHQAIPPQIVNCPADNDRCIRIEATVEFFRLLNRK